MMKSPNPMEMVKNLIGNNNQAMQMYNQLQGMTKEQQAEQIANLCNQNGISKEQLKQLFGYK